MKVTILFSFLYIVLADSGLFDSGFKFVNTDGSGSFYEDPLPAGMSESVRTYRQLGDQVRIIYFGGLIESLKIAEITPDGVKTYDNIYFNDIWEYSPSLKGYIRIDPATSVRPSPRAYAAGGFDPRTNKLYIFGGTNAPAILQNITPANFFRDTWSFDYDTLTWTEEFPVGHSPGDRSTPGYGSNGHSLYLFSGASFDTLFKFGVFNPNDLYKLEFPGNDHDPLVWTQLRAPGQSEIPGRTQCDGDHVPGTTKIVFTGGDTVFANYKRVTRGDVFVYDYAKDDFYYLNNSTFPQPIITQGGFAAVGPNVFLLSGGDEQGNSTVDNSCTNPNFTCSLDASPTNKTYFYNLKHQFFGACDFDLEIPSLRRSTLAAYIQLPSGKTITLDKFFELPPLQRLFGKVVVILNQGYGWNGTPHGYGEKRNLYTFELKIQVLLVQ